MCRVRPLATIFDPTFVNSQRFQYVINQHNQHLFRRGELIEFPESFQDKEYHTLIGPCFRHDFVPLKSDDRGLVGAIRRMTQVRKPLQPGLHATLILNQYLMPSYLGGPLRKFIDETKAKLIDLLRNETREELYLRWLNQPMPKKQLKIRANSLIVAHGIDNAYCKYVNYKCKKGEWLPRDKYLRAVADIGTPGSTRCGLIMDQVKSAFQHFQIGREFLYIFVKAPKHDDLVAAFKELWFSTYKVVMVCFSDDSCISLDYGSYVGNMDISACDGSNYEPVFQILEEIMTADSRFTEDVRGAFDQLKLPLKVRFTEGKVMLKSRFGRSLYSGSVLTTVSNCLCNLIIGLSISKNIDTHAGNYDRYVELAARRVGFIVKLFKCNHIEELQFLKHSPCYTREGELSCVLNLGVFLRTCGRVRGDVPGKKSDALRFDKYRSEIARSLQHAGNCGFYSAVRKRFIIKPRMKMLQHQKTEDRGLSSGALSDDSVARRYGFTSAQMDELNLIILSSKAGYHYDSDLIRQVIRKDYG